MNLVSTFCPQANVLASHKRQLTRTYFILNLCRQQECRLAGSFEEARLDPISKQNIRGMAGSLPPPADVAQDLFFCGFINCSTHHQKCRCCHLLCWSAYICFPQPRLTPGSETLKFSINTRFFYLNIVHIFKTYLHKLDLHCYTVDITLAFVHTKIAC